jgi:antibiotic biosynthesis monooxygenase (ABM) superfamily enzyme
MYGTIARFRVKSGAESQLVQLQHEFEALKVPGYVKSTVYRMDADPGEYYLAVVFDSRESYVANANSPEQDARFRAMLSLMDGEPQWHDGEIIYVGP